MEKQLIKKSEAKVLVYLSVADLRFRFVSQISFKLKMEYNFLLLRLREMKMKGWVTRTHAHNKTFYTVTTIAPLETARKVNSGEQK